MFCCCGGGGGGAAVLSSCSYFFTVQAGSYSFMDTVVVLLFCFLCILKLHFKLMHLQCIRFTEPALVI